MRCLWKRFFSIFCFCFPFSAQWVIIHTAGAIEKNRREALTVEGNELRFVGKQKDDDFLSLTLR